jgi:hypothetical protein
MTGDEFVEAIRQLQRSGDLSDDQVCSSLAGIVINLCWRSREDPVEYMQWAIGVVQNVTCPHGYRLVDLADGTTTCEDCRRPERLI